MPIVGIGRDTDSGVWLESVNDNEDIANVRDVARWLSLNRFIIAIVKCLSIENGENGKGITCILTPSKVYLNSFVSILIHHLPGVRGGSDVSNSNVICSCGAILSDVTL